MSGYNNFSKSNNAVSAELDNRFPLSVVAKKAKITTAFIKEHFSPCEWHHSSSWYNKVDYYDLDAITEWLETEDGKSAIAKHKASPKGSEKVYTNCKVEWLDWYGTRNHPKCVEMKADGATVSVKGQTATVTLDNGTVFTKRLSTNGFSFYPA